MLNNEKNKIVYFYKYKRYYFVKNLWKLNE